MKLGLTLVAIWTVFWLPISANISSAAERLRVSVSILPQAYFVERIAGSHAATHVIIPKGANPEIYEPTPQQLVSLSDSQLYVRVGAPGFPFEERFLRILMGATQKIRVVNMSDGMVFRKDDPHVWVAPSAVRIAAKNIARALQAYDPPHRDDYQSGLDGFIRDIDLLDQEIKGALAQKRGFTFMVYHPAWGYFADEFGLRQLAIEAEGKPANAAHIRATIDLARNKGIRAILVQKGFDTKSARAIARDIDGKVLEVDPLERDWLAGMRHFSAVLSQTLRP